MNGVSRNSVSRILKKEIYPDISINYDFSKYEKRINQHHNDEIIRYTDMDIDKVVKVCDLIDSNKYTLREISEKTDVHYQTVRNIYYCTSWKDISKNYNFGKKKEDRPLYEKRKQQVEDVCKLLDNGLNSFQVSEITGMNASTIRNILAGKSWVEISSKYEFYKTVGHVKEKK